MADELAERVSRITPQEWRVIALSIEGMSVTDACEALGIAPGTLESHKQAIRRKLGIPKGTRFEAFVRENFAEGVEIPEPRSETRTEPRSLEDKAAADRRVRWLLRITLDEVQELATSAGLRAQLLKQTATRMSSDTDEALTEVEDLQYIADRVSALFDESLARVRARGKTN